MTRSIGGKRFARADICNLETDSDEWARNLSGVAAPTRVRVAPPLCVMAPLLMIKTLDGT